MMLQVLLTQQELDGLFALVDAGVRATGLQAFDAQALVLPRLRAAVELPDPEAAKQKEPE